MNAKECLQMWMWVGVSSETLITFWKNRDLICNEVTLRNYHALSMCKAGNFPRQLMSVRAVGAHACSLLCMHGTEDTGLRLAGFLLLLTKRGCEVRPITAVGWSRSSCCFSCLFCFLRNSIVCSLLPCIPDSTLKVGKLHFLQSWFSSSVLASSLHFFLKHLKTTLHHLSNRNPTAAWSCY